MKIEFDKMTKVSIYGGYRYEVRYFVTYNDNIYICTCEIRGLPSYNPELTVYDVKLPEDTNEHTLTKDAIIEKIEEELHVRNE